MRALLSLAFLLAACGNEPAAPAADAPPATPAPAAPAAAPAGDALGQPLTLSQSTPVSTLVAEIDKYDGQKVRVEGTVTEVCAKRGCWMTIASDTPGKDLRFKVEDGVLTIPLAAKGRYAVAEGTARKVTLSPEDAQAMREHEAEEQGQPVDNSQPLPTYIVKLEGTGAVIRDQM
jgi:hypothetical protein